MSNILKIYSNRYHKENVSSEVHGIPVWSVEEATFRKLGAYDIQQELMIVYEGELNIQVEIASITNIRAMERVFEMYHPQIVINAAAHKHVPLMEHNCI